LASYCQDSSIDVLVLSFLTTYFGTGNAPEINFSNACPSSSTVPGTDLFLCSQIGEDIKTCQAAGKIVLLSMGGENSNSSFSSASQATQFAQTVWNYFGGGSTAASHRPFGDAVIDGFDLGISPLYIPNLTY
jgi:chitinase